MDIWYAVTTGRWPSNPSPLFPVSTAPKPGQFKGTRKEKQTGGDKGARLNPV